MYRHTMIPSNDTPAHACPVLLHLEPPPEAQPIQCHEAKTATLNRKHKLEYINQSSIEDTPDRNLNSGSPGLALSWFGF